MMAHSRRTAALAACFAAALATPAGAGSLLYTPVNPSFGGSPWNGGWLLSQAQAQNQYTSKPKAQSPLANLTGGGVLPLSPGQQFANQLTAQLYSSLANKITEAMFGPNAQTSGSYSFQGTTVSFNRVGNDINITINDGQTITTIAVPAT
jgi:curli production assembly/transport component CsgF